VTENPDNPGTYDGPSREPGSQVRVPLLSDSPGLTLTPSGANLQGAAPCPTPSDRPRHPIRAWGSRGRRFKSGRPDQCLAGQKGFRILVRDPFLIFGSQTGPDLVAVDGLGDRCATVAPQVQVADVLDADA
jgi:hypothetical protein